MVKTINYTLKSSASLTAVFLLLITSSLIYGQYSPELEKYKLLYPKSNAVTLNSNSVVRITMKDDEVQIFEDLSVETLYLNATARYNSERSISYSSFYEINKLKASSFVYEDGKYKEKKISDFKTSDEFTESFHDDIKSISFVYPNLSKGAKSLISYQTKIKNPRFLKSVFLSQGRPIVKKKITFHVDNDIQLEFKKFNLDSIEVNFNKTVNKKETIYTWEINQIPEFEYNESIMSFRSEIPHIIPIIRSYNLKNKKVNLLNDVGGLYSWYYSLIKDINTSENHEEFKPLVDSLTKNCDTELQKVKNIYYWVQQNIKYIAFEDGLGGFVPRNANDVFQKKYGDCKDNSSILQVMLNTANIKGYITWVGTRKLPYRYSEVPTPVVDNHMILTYIDSDSSFYFLDATGRYLDIDRPSSFIQGKETLIAIDSSHFLIRKVPVVEANRNTEIDSCYLKVVDNKLVGTASHSYNGYPKTIIFSYLEGEINDTDLKSFYKSELEKGNNNFLIDSIKEVNKYQYEKPFSVNYSFSIPNYIKKAGNDIYINLNLNPELSFMKPEKTHEGRIEYKYKTSHTNYYELEIPTAFKLKYLPENITVSNAIFDSSIEFNQKENIITYKHVLTMKKTALTASDVILLKKEIRKIEKHYKEVVVLTKK